MEILVVGFVLSLVTFAVLLFLLLDWRDFVGWIFTLLGYLMLGVTYLVGMLAALGYLIGLLLFCWEAFLTITWLIFTGMSVADDIRGVFSLSLQLSAVCGVAAFLSLVFSWLAGKFFEK